jgi:hypothetical protein
MIPGQHADRPVLTTRRDGCPDVSFQMLPEVNQRTGSFRPSSNCSALDPWGRQTAAPDGPRPVRKSLAIRCE